MTPISPDIWTRLSGERPQGQHLWARRAAPEITDRLIAAIDIEDQRHLLVLLRANEIDLNDTQSRGLSVSTRVLRMPGQEPGRYIDIVCQDPAGHDAFDLIGSEVATRLATEREAAHECVSRVLAKWRRFWGQLSNQHLSYEQQLGLFAELWFLSIWLMPRIGCREAVSRWRGPSGARHDFEWVSKSIEVKATIKARGRIHHINGLDQLAPPEQGELLLFSLRLREEGGATNTLPSLVAACRAALEPTPEILGDFENALVQTGYSPAHDDEYSKLRLRVTDEDLYSVREDFPMITSKSFPNGIPSGIERVEYEINLSGYDHLILARSASEMPNL